MPTTINDWQKVEPINDWQKVEPTQPIPAEKSVPEPWQQTINSMSGPERFLTGVGAGMYDVGMGIAQLAARAGNKLGLVDDSTVNDITNRGLDARKEFGYLRGQSNAALGGEILGKTAPFLVVPGGVAGGALQRAATSAIAGGALGGAELVGPGESRLENAGRGALFGAGGSAVMSGAGKVYNALVGPETKSVAQLLSERFNIPITLSERTGTSSRLDSQLEQLPTSLFGTGMFRKQQQEAAKREATGFFSRYVIDPALGNTAAMKAANDAHIDALYNQVRSATATVPRAAAPEVKSAAQNLLDRYPSVFESIQDNKVKRILKDIYGDTSDKAVKSNVLDANGNPIITNVTPTFSFDDLWELRKGIGEAIGGAKTPAEKAQFSRIYSAVSNDMDNMLRGTTGAWAAFREANDAFKKYSVKFDVLREAYDKASGTIGAGTNGFFSPQKFGTELKNLANDPKYKKNVAWSPAEINEMTGLANILQVVKRAGQYLENPPTGNRWGLSIGGITAGGAAAMAGGIPAIAGTAGATAGIAGIVRFLTTTPQGQRLALSASKIHPSSNGMRILIDQMYSQMPKVSAGISEQVLGVTGE